VARRVDDVELEETALGANVGYARDFGQNGDSAFLFKVVAVHQALADSVAGAERVALVQHGVDERGLAVVYVRDDGKVAYGRRGDSDTVECSSRCSAAGDRR
jgi:hypothetical protein